MMQINWNRLIVLLLPVRLRTATLHGYISSLIAPLVSLYNSLLSYNAITTYKLRHTSQVWSIEKVLNDEFDPVERRVRIFDAGGNSIVPLYPDADLRSVSLDDDLTGCLILQADSGYDNGDFDFVVRLPYRYADSQVYHMKSLVNFYKLAGKRYDIIFLT